MEEQERYTISYRSVETCQVMDWIRAGQCGCLIGLRGAGKSNFLHFLFREDVRSHCLGQEKDNYLFISLDLLSLAEHNNWSVYELILQRLTDKIQSWMGSAVPPEVIELRQQVQHSRDVLSAQRALEKIVNIFCQRSERRLVFFFDEFDEVFRSFSSDLFRHLRSLRDAHKERLSYIIIASNDLSHLRSDLSEVEHFYRLVSRNLCGLGPYNETDAQQMINYLALQRSRKLSPANIACLVELSGGHAGLLKAITSLLWGPEYDGDLDKLSDTINDESILLCECRKIWDNLPEDEQTALCSLGRNESASLQIVNWLKFRGIARKTNPPRLFSPLFEKFVLKQLPPSTAGTLIRRSPRFVQLDGHPIGTLTELEFEALCYLYEHRERVCTKEDLIQAVYRQQYGVRGGGLTDAMLQTLISRLREKIEPDHAHPRYVITIRGEGYRFVDPGNSGQGQ